MAYFQKPRDKDRNGFGATLSAATPGPRTGTLPGAAPGAPTSTGGYTNLATYLGLNQAKGQEMAGQLAGGVTGKLNEAAGYMTGGEREFGGALSQAKEQGKASPFASVQDTKGWEKGVAALNEVAPKAKQLAGGFNQRQGLVNETFGKGATNYSQGMGLYDNALASHYGGKQFENTAKLADYLTGRAEVAPGATASASASHNSGVADPNAANEKRVADNAAKQQRESEVASRANRAGYSLEEYLAKHPEEAEYINSGTPAAGRRGTLDTVGR